MKILSRNGGRSWPICLVILLFLLLPLEGYSQETGEEGGQESTGELQSPVTSTDGTVFTSEAGEILTVGQPEIIEVPPVPLFEFQKPPALIVKDRPNDEGGAFALTWASSPSDVVKSAKSETGEEETAGGTYQVYHSTTGEPGSWELIDQIPSNKKYVYEEPRYFGFFLSEKNKGSRMHYSFFENTYPGRGIYSYELKPDEENPNKILISASVYDEKLTDADYQKLQVMVNLKPFGGDKVTLTYEPLEQGVEKKPWDNHYKGEATIDTSKLDTTRPYYILFTAPGVRGQRKAALGIQPSAGAEPGMISVSGSGKLQDVPDNRDPHYFRLYVTPVDYTTPEGQELPPEEWLVGEQVGPVIAKGNVWNFARTNSCIGAILICIAVMTFINRAKKGAPLFVRRIAGLDHVEEAIGRATEMGRPILYVMGIGAMSDIATIASVNILGRVARKVANYESRLLVPAYDPIAMAVCQEVVQDAYIDAGRPDAYNKDDIFYLTSDQFAYAAAIDGIMMRERPATNLLIGVFFAESLLIAETGASTRAIQIAGTDQLHQLPFFVTACDYTLIGEELYAASAYISREPMLLGSLKGQDLIKAILMILVFLGTIMIFFSDKLPALEFIKKLFQAF